MKHCKIITRTFAGILVAVAALAVWNPANAQALSKEQVEVLKQRTPEDCKAIETNADVLYDLSNMYKTGEFVPTAAEKMAEFDPSPLEFGMRKLNQKLDEALKASTLSDQGKLDLKRQNNLTYTFFKNNKSNMFVVSKESFLKLVNKECLETVHRYKRTILE